MTSELQEREMAMTQTPQTARDTDGGCSAFYFSPARKGESTETRALTPLLHAGPAAAAGQLVLPGP